MVAVEIVEMLDLLFSRFDALAERFGVEKIKTIGDGYMVAGGVPDPRPDHAAAVVEMALAMGEATNIATRALGVLGQPLRVRIGIHSGPLVAGVLGTNKLIYDVWGDTVNTSPAAWRNTASPGAFTSPARPARCWAINTG